VLNFNVCKFGVQWLSTDFLHPTSLQVTRSHFFSQGVPGFLCRVERVTDALTLIERYGRHWSRALLGAHVIRDVSHVRVFGPTSHRPQES
jgi:hypothetical protein